MQFHYGASQQAHKRGSLNVSFLCQGIKGRFNGIAVDTLVYEYI